MPSDSLFPWSENYCTILGEFGRWELGRDGKRFFGAALENQAWRDVRTTIIVLFAAWQTQVQCMVIECAVFITLETQERKLTIQCIWHVILWIVSSTAQYYQTWIICIHRYPIDKLYLLSIYSVQTFEKNSFLLRYHVRSFFDHKTDINIFNLHEVDYKNKIMVKNKILLELSWGIK